MFAGRMSHGSQAGRMKAEKPHETTQVHSSQKVFLAGAGSQAVCILHEYYVLRVCIS